MYLTSDFTNGSGKALNATNLNNIERAAFLGIGRTMDAVYYNANNCLLLSSCDDDGWVNGRWNNSSGTYVSNPYKVFGTYGAEMRSPVADYGIKIVKNLDMTKANNQQSTLGNDAFVRFFIYIPEAQYNYMTDTAYIEIIFPNDNSGTLTNYAYYRVMKAQLASNITYYKAFSVKKSSFTQVGSFSWANVKGISVSCGGTITGEVAIIIDHIELCREDAINTSYANPFQRHLGDGVYYPDWAVNNSTATWHCTPSGTRVVIQNNSLTNDVLGLKLVGTWGSFIKLSMYNQCKNSYHLYSIVYYVDSNNFVRVTIGDATLEIKETINGSVNQTISTLIPTITLDSYWNIRFFKEGKYYHAEIVNSSDVATYPYYAVGLYSNIGDSGNLYLDNSNNTANDRIQSLTVSTF